VPLLTYRGMFCYDYMGDMPSGPLTRWKHGNFAQTVSLNAQNADATEPSHFGEPRAIPTGAL
jgi:hypothetical protein